jgi:hypothetical protein
VDDADRISAHPGVPAGIPVCQQATKKIAFCDDLSESGGRGVVVMLQSGRRL